MFAIEEAKLPPPTPASGRDDQQRGVGDARLEQERREHGRDQQQAALKMVQLRPPNRATAKVYGSRSTAPTASARR